MVGTEIALIIILNIKIRVNRRVVNLLKGSKRLYVGLILLLIVSLFTACSSGPAKEDATSQNNNPTNTGSSTETTSPKEEKDYDETATIRVAVEAEPISLDPQNVTDGNSITVQKPMFEGLLGFDDQMKPIPVLATDYSFNDDATELTFTLREGVTFHDGSPFNAEVVKANLDFVRDPNNGLARKNFFSFIKEVVVIDDTHVKIVSETPNSTMVSYLAHGSASMKSLESINKKKNDPSYNLDRNPVGTGPFMFKEWKDNQYVEMVPYDNYWNKDAKAKFASVKYIPVVEAGTRINMLKANEIDVITKLPTQIAKELSQDSNFNVFTAPSLNVFYVGINMQNPKYEDVKVRQAMNHAINKDELIASVLDGYGTVADSVIAPNTLGYSKQKVYEHDPELAKKLLAEAGYADGFEATLWTRNSSEFIAIAENVALQLDKVGIKAKVQAFESGTLFDMLDYNQGTDLWIGRWSPGTGEANYGIRPNFHTVSFGPNDNNSGFYSNPEVDRLLDEVIRTADSKEAAKMYAEIQKILYEDAAWVFLHVPDNVVAKSSSVSNVIVLPGDTVIVNGAQKK